MCLQGSLAFVGMIFETDTVNNHRSVVLRSRHQGLIKHGKLQLLYMGVICSEVISAINQCNVAQRHLVIDCESIGNSSFFMRL